jgi:hypothetical protein
VLGDLAGAARDDVLVTFAAGLRVVGRPEPSAIVLDLLEHEAVVVERTQRDDRVLVERVERRPCGSKPLVRLSKAAGASRNGPPNRLGPTAVARVERLTGGRLRSTRVRRE